MSPAVPPLIIITGEAGHGKDTIGDYLIENFGYQRVSFSDCLRTELAAAYAAAPLPVDEDFLSRRDSKNVPQARLALRYCADQDFVALALSATAAEDQALFNKLNHSPHQPAALFLPTAMRGHWSIEERLALPREPRRLQQVWGTEYRRAQDPDYWLKAAARTMAPDVPKVISSGRYQNEVDFAYAQGGERWHVVRPGHKEVTVAHSSEQIAPVDARTLVVENDGTLPDLYAKVGGILTLWRARAATSEPSSAPSRAVKLAL
jgi:hypothetical protein